MTGRKHNQTGRSSGRFASAKFRRANSPPAGEPWVWLTGQMLESPAFRVLSGGAVHVIGRIAIEHMAHGRGENGALPVTHNDFVAYGIRRRSILQFLSEAIALGFIDRTQKGVRSYGGLEGAPARYRLTWLPTHDNQPATNDWKRFTTVIDAEQAVAAAHAELAAKRVKEKINNPRQPPRSKPRYAVAAE